MWYGRDIALVSINGVIYAANFSQGRTQLHYDLCNGDYTIDVTLVSPIYYAEDISDTFTITDNPCKNDTPMDIELDDINVGDSVVIIVKVPDYASGNITVYVTGKDGGTFTSQIIGGRVTATTSAWTVAGEFSAIATYEGDDYYNSSFTTSTFSVQKVTPDVMLLMSGGTYDGESTKFKVYVPNDATGTVTFKVEEIPLDTVAVENGMVTVTEHIVYNGNDKYYSASTSGTVTVQKAVPLISISSDDIMVGDKAIISATLQEYADDGNCKIEFPSLGSSFTQTQTVLGGKVIFEIRNLPAGTHSFTVTYLGNDLVSTGSESATILVSNNI